MATWGCGPRRTPWQISLKKMGYRITYDSNDGYYIVHSPRGKVKFYEDENGLPYISLDDATSTEAITMLQIDTVRKNFEGFTKREVAQAKFARQSQAMVGAPSDKDYHGLVSGNISLRNIPFTGSDVTNAKKIFGPDLAGVRGKTVRKKPVPVVESYVAIPRDFVLNNKLSLWLPIYSLWTVYRFF